MSKSTTGRQMLEALERRVSEAEKRLDDLEQPYRQLKKRFDEMTKSQGNNTPSVENA